MSKPIFYSVTDLDAIEGTDRDVNGVYFLRTPSGFKMSRVADTPSRSFIPMDKTSGVMVLGIAVGISLDSDTDSIICTVSGSAIGMPNPANHKGRVVKFTCTFTGGYVDLSGFPIKNGTLTVSQLGGRTSATINTPRSIEVISSGSEWVLMHRGL